MASVGFATLQIVPSIRGVEAAINRELSGPLALAGGKAGEDSGKSYVSSLTRTLGGATVAIAKAATVGFAAAGAGLVALGAFGVKAAADFQQTRIAFEGIFGSAKKANDFLQELRSFAAKTPFEFPELTASAKNLLAVGFAAEEVIPIMTTLGNTAATLGVGGPAIEGVVRALGQMKGKGKASAQELNQISEQIPGFSAIQAIAEKLGVSTAEAFKLMEQGAVSADVGITAILEGMQRFPGAAGAMERQSKTLNGVLSTLKDTIRDALVDAIEPFLPALSRGLASVGPKIGVALAAVTAGITSFVAFITANRKTIGDVFETIGDTARQAFGVAASFIRPFVDAIREALPPIVALARDGFNIIAPIIREQLLPALKVMAPILGTIGAAFIRLAGFLAKNRAVLLALVGPTLAVVAGLKAFAALQAVITFIKSLQAAVFLLNLALLANPVFLIVAGITALGVAIVLAYQRFKPFRDVVDAVGRALKDAFDFTVRNWKLLGAILLAPFLPFIAIVAAIVLNWNTLVAFFRGLINTIVGLFQTDFGERLIGFVTSTFENIRQIIQGGLDVITGVFQFFKALFTGDWAALWDAVKQIFSGVWAIIGGIFKQALNYIGLLLTAAWEAITNSVKVAWNAIVAFFRDLPGRIIGFLVAIADAARTLGASIVSGVIDEIKKLPGEILKTIVAFGSVIVDAGKRIIDLIIRGIKSAPGALVDAIEGLIPGGGIVGNALDSIGGFFGAEGGFVPLPQGQPALAILHGGEQVLTPAQQEGRGGGSTTINVFGRSDDDMLRKLGIEQRRQSLLSPVPA